MYTESLEQELRSYFREEVHRAEPSLDWWNDMVSRVTAKKPSRLRRSFWTQPRMVLIGMLLATLLISGGVYGGKAIVEELFSQNAPSVETAGLAQKYELSQTLDGVTVRFERAYADANTVLVGFTISGPSSNYYTEGMELTTSDGQVIPGMFGIGTVPGSEFVMGSWRESERNACIYSFDSSAITTLSSELDLQLNIELSGRVLPGVTQAVDGQFSFDFTVPFSGGQVIGVNQTIEAAGVNIVLKEIAISPWGTRAAFEKPAAYAGNAGGCLLIANICTAGGETKNAWMGNNSGTEGTLYFNGDFTGQSGIWTVTVTEIVLPAAGAGHHSAEETQRIAGPWIFQVAVP